MSPERMQHLLELVGPRITKKDTNFRKAISASDRLMLTLRYLASGDSQISLTYTFRMGKKTVSRIISETTRAIYQSLINPYFSPPTSSAQWRLISDDFEKRWQFPHVVGAIDGKHVRIKAPNKSGTYYHNYKGFFSLQLLAICDANYKFIFADVGQYGSNNDCAVLSCSKIGKRLEQGTMNLPSDEKITGIDIEIPFYLLGDEIFPLQKWLMRPYPGKLPEQEQVFNYRQSRARLPIENSFGILTARWRIFETPIKAKPENARFFVLACIALHNYLRLTENSLYTPWGFIDVASKGGNIIEGDWRKHSVDDGSLKNIVKLKGRRQKNSAKTIREKLKVYFNEKNILPWQLEKVQNVGPTPELGTESFSDSSFDSDSNSESDCI